MEFAEFDSAAIGASDTIAGAGLVDSTTAGEFAEEAAATGTGADSGVTGAGVESTTIVAAGEGAGAGD